jgi:hypothetical protein
MLSNKNNHLIKLMAQQGGLIPVPVPMPMQQQQPLQPPLDQQPLQQPFDQQPLQQPLDQPLQPPLNQPLQPPLNQPLQPPFDQPLQPPFDQPLQQPFDQPLQQPFDQPPFEQQPLQQPPFEQQPIVQQPIVQQPFDQQQPLFKDDYLYHNITSQEIHNNIKVYVCTFSIEQTYIKYYMQKQNTIVMPQFMFTYQEPALYQGGYQDSAESGDPLDAAFIQKCQEFIANSTYVGYIPNISEPGSVYAFMKVVAPPANLVPCISNELFYLFKVGSIAVDTTIINMFTNNKWLVSASDPFSGYACKLDGTTLVNIAQGETPDLVDISSVGSYYYFSFLPLNDNSAPLDRYVLFPQEYTCVKTLEPEFENDTDSIYLDGALVPGKQLFALTLPTQFAKIE